MIKILSVSVSLLAPDEDGDRRLAMVLDVDNQGPHVGDLEVAIELIDEPGALLFETTMYGEPLCVGRQLAVLTTYTKLPIRPVRASWRIRYRRSRRFGPWHLGVGGVPPKEAPLPEAANPAAAAPLQALPQPHQAAPPVAPSPAPPAPPAPAPPPPAQTAPAEAPAEEAAPAPPARRLPPKPRNPYARPPRPDKNAGAFAALAEGGWEAAEPLFAADGLDARGRERVRDMLRSDEPDSIAMGVRIAATTGWRSAVQNMRRLVEHPDARVRLEVAAALGVLAGRSMLSLVRQLMVDEDEGVKAAAEASYERLSG